MADENTERGGSAGQPGGVGVEPGDPRLPDGGAGEPVADPSGPAGGVE